MALLVRYVLRPDAACVFAAGFEHLDDLITSGVDLLIHVCNRVAMQLAHARLRWQPCRQA